MEKVKEPIKKKVKKELAECYGCKNKAQEVKFIEIGCLRGAAYPFCQTCINNKKIQELNRQYG